MKEGVSILQGIGDQAGVARGYYEICRIYYWIYGDSTRSYEFLDKSCQIYYELGFRERWVYSRIAMGMFLIHLGKYDDGYHMALDTLPIAEDYNLGREIGFVYYDLGMVGLVKGDLKQAYEWALKSARYYDELGVTEFLCHTLAELIYINRGLGQSEEAVNYFCQALRTAIPIKAFFPILHTILAAALLLADQGESVMGVEITALANRYPNIANSHWFDDVAGREINAIAENLPPEMVAAAQERGLKRDVWETANELLELFEGE